MARLCIINGQPNFLHDLQQSVPAGIQKGPFVPVQKQGNLATRAHESSVAAAEMRLRFSQPSLSRRHKKS
jgi:hypothetical protein